MKALSDHDAELVQRLLDDRRNSRGNPPNRADHRDEGHQAPEVYVALTPLAGIPALQRQTTTGTGTGSHSGGIWDDVPGSADCEIYRVLPGPILRYTGQVKTVYNLSTASVDGSAFALVVRDKYGQWFAVRLPGRTYKDDGDLNLADVYAMPLLSEPGSSANSYTDLTNHLVDIPAPGTYLLLGTSYTNHQAAAGSVFGDPFHAGVSVLLTTTTDSNLDTVKFNPGTLSVGDGSYQLAWNDHYAPYSISSAGPDRTLTIATLITATGSAGQSGGLGFSVSNSGFRNDIIEFRLHLGIYQLSEISVTNLDGVISGTTPIAGGTDKAILYDNSGTLGESSASRIRNGLVETKTASNSWMRFTEGSF